ncbi:alpha/beta fold hydrolase [Streptosporangium sandarakinum]|uniref:alpha/beta fold hydrolase n=1 Tax=Streptosporangium sandarakinum TaxID=1260955 RepID=UPI00371649E5
MAESEREYIREKFFEDRASARERGRHGGRPKVCGDDVVACVRSLRERGVSVPDCAASVVGYEVHGAADGEPVLLLGGTSMPRGVWAMMQLSALVEAGYQVAVVDPRGAGESSAPGGVYTIAELADDVAGLAQRLGWTGVRVMGLSQGGFVATGKRKGHNPSLAGIYRALAEHGKAQRHPDAVEQVRAGYAAFYKGL